MRHGHAMLVLGALAGASASGCWAGVNEVRLEPAQRNRLGDEREIHAVYYAPVPLRVVRWGGTVELFQGVTRSNELMELRDPVSDVEGGFVEGLREELRLTNLRPAERPMDSPHVAARGAEIAPLQAAFGGGLVFDFDTIAWDLAFVSRSFVDNAATTYGIDYGVRARLVRLSDSTVLWQGICNFRNGDAPRPWRDLEANEFEVLRARRDEVAKACARELLGSFTGRTARSMWSGRNEPK